MGLDDSHFALASLGDLMELLVEGWRIEKMQYADRSGPSGPPAAYFSLVRGATGEVRGVYVPDDGRALSHRALVELFREHPGVWKHRSFASVDAAGRRRRRSGATCRSRSRTRWCWCRRRSARWFR